MYHRVFIVSSLLKRKRNDSHKHIGGEGKAEGSFIIRRGNLIRGGRERRYKYSTLQGPLMLFGLTS